MAENERDNSTEWENKPTEAPCEEEPGHPFWPTHVLDQAIVFYVLAGVVITLAILVPFQLHGPADPLHTPEGIKPEWYFLASYQAIKYVPKTVGIVAFGLAGLAFIIWPFIDQLIERRFGPRAYRKIGATALAMVVLLGMLGWVSERTFTVMGQSYHIDLLGVPHKISIEDTEQGQSSAEEQAPERNSPKETLGDAHEGN